jgi:flagellar biosynthesis/type III secretory pathway protein FliH
MTVREEHTCWFLTAPNGRTWEGESPFKVCAAAHRDTIDPALRMKRINEMVEEETAIHDQELATARAEGFADGIEAAYQKGLKAAAQGEGHD